MLQVGIGLLVLQQLGGINGVLFYSSTIFASAGRVSKSLSLTFGMFHRENKHASLFHFFHLGVSSSNVATFGVGAVQVM